MGAKGESGCSKHSKGHTIRGLSKSRGSQSRPLDRRLPLGVCTCNQALVVEVEVALEEALEVALEVACQVPRSTHWPALKNGTDS